MVRRPCAHLLQGSGSTAPAADHLIRHSQVMLWPEEPC